MMRISLQKEIHNENQLIIEKAKELIIEIIKDLDNGSK